MSTEKTVVLARPHPMIVREMQEFLKRNGYNAVATEDLSEITRLGKAGAVGVVISTTVVAGTNASHGDMLTAVRSALPSIPILVATLLPGETLARNLGHTLGTMIPPADLIQADTGNLNNTKLGTNAGILAVHRDDITKPASQDLSDRLIRKHFA